MLKMFAYGVWLMQVITPLPQTDLAWTFVVGPGNDVYAVRRSGGESGRTELSILSAGSKYQEFKLQTPTALDETDWRHEFLIAANGDLFAIRKKGNLSNKTELIVLSAESRYQEKVLDTPLAIAETDASQQFLILPNRDLMVVQKHSTASQKTELTLLTAASKYQEPKGPIETLIGEVGWVHRFALAPNGDLVMIHRSRTSTRSTEVHILSAEEKYQKWVMQTPTLLPETFDDCEFGIGESRELIMIRKNGAGQSTEVHVLSPDRGWCVKFVDEKGELVDYLPVFAPTKEQALAERDVARKLEWHRHVHSPGVKAEIAEEGSCPAEFFPWSLPRK